MKLTKMAIVAITIFTAKDAAAVDIFISGTTAIRDLLPVIMNKICQPASAATPRILVEAAPSISGSKGQRANDSAIVPIEDPDRRVLKCHTHSSATDSVVATALDVNADKDLTVYMSNEVGDSTNGSGGLLDNLLGGSITGIATLAPYQSPATKQATVQFLDTSSGCSLNGNVDNTKGSANGNNAVGVPVNGYGFIGASKYTCTLQKSGIQTDIGMTEVEPDLFTLGYKNLPTTVGNSVVPDEWKSFDVSAFAGSNPTNFSPVYATAYIVAVQDVVPLSQISNITQAQLAQIFSGNIRNWSALGGPDLNIKVCTRVPGAGIKAAFNQLISRVGCKTNTAADGTAGFEYGVKSAVSLSSYGYRYALTGLASGVRENANAAEVQQCMTDNKSPKGDLTQIAGGTLANNGAIGIFGLEDVAAASTTMGYHYLAFSGINPVDLSKTTDTVDGAADGVLKDKVALGYPLWVQSTIQKSPTLVDANKLAFYNYLAAHSGDIEFTKVLPGLLTLDDNRTGAPIGPSHTPGTGNMYYTRTTSGVSDTCGADLYQ